MSERVRGVSEIDREARERLQEQKNTAGKETQE